MLCVEVPGSLIVVASLAVENGLWGCTGSVAPWHAESSWTSNRTHAPCIGRQIFNH